MQLFMIYIGGRTTTSLIELHDTRFVVANTIEDTYPQLKADWWGVPESLHLDSWGVVKSADGHHVHLTSTPSNSEQKLYFVNLGGYDPSAFTELHNNVLVVAPDIHAAKARALTHVAGWQMPHKDYLYQIENICCLENIAAGEELYIHLEPTTNPTPFEFTSTYIPIGK